jgi:hypothetical protein
MLLMPSSDEAGTATGASARIGLAQHFAKHNEYSSRTFPTTSTTNALSNPTDDSNTGVNFCPDNMAATQGAM